MDLKNEKPLAKCHIKDGEIFYYLDFHDLDKVCVHNQLGKDLIDFVWIDEALIQNVFSSIFEKYLYCVSIKMSFDDIFDALLESTRTAANKNGYLSAYILMVIEILLKPFIDKEFIELIAEYHGATHDDLVNTYYVQDLKGMLIKIMPLLISSQQKALEEDLELIIGDKSNLKDYTPAQRLYMLEHSKSLSTNYLETKFFSTLDSPFDFRDMDDKMIKKAIDRNQIDFYEMYELQTIDDMLRFEMVQMISKNCLFKRCKYCCKFFIPTGRTDSEYCDRIMSGEVKPCNEIGAFRVRNIKMKDSPIHKAYMQAYHRMDSRKRHGNLTQKKFQEWSWQAIDMRDKCLASKITLEEYQVWLDQTKKRE